MGTATTAAQYTSLVDTQYGSFASQVLGRYLLNHFDSPGIAWRTVAGDSDTGSRPSERVVHRRRQEQFVAPAPQAQICSILPEGEPNVLENWHCRDGQTISSLPLSLLQATDSM